MQSLTPFSLIVGSFSSYVFLWYISDAITSAGKKITKKEEIEDIIKKEYEKLGIEDSFELHIKEKQPDDIIALNNTGYSVRLCAVTGKDESTSMHHITVYTPITKGTLKHEAYHAKAHRIEKSDNLFFQSYYRLKEVLVYEFTASLYAAFGINCHACRYKIF